ncbi:MAG: hypothetical protein ACI87E_000309 [Mariniblastus sp.]|jgi:hypothetical protein
MDAAFIYSNLFTPVKNEFPSNRLTSHDVGPFSLLPPLSPVQCGPRLSSPHHAVINLGSHATAEVTISTFHGRTALPPEKLRGIGHRWDQQIGIPSDWQLRNFPQPDSPVL